MLSARQKREEGSLYGNIWALVVLDHYRGAQTSIDRVYRYINSNDKENLMILVSLLSLSIIV
jgi:hypothetical protein